MPVFPEIAESAQRLRVGFGAFSSHKAGDDVIQVQIFRTSAPCTAVFAPVLLLCACPFGVSGWAHKGLVIWIHGQAAIRGRILEALLPQVFRGNADFLPGFWGMVVAFGVLIAKAMPLQSGRNTRAGLFRVRLSVKRIVGASAKLCCAVFAARNRCAAYL